VNPENLAQIFVPTDANCKIGSLDFFWLMAGTKPKTPNATLRCNILKRLETVPADTANKAACPKEQAPGESCTDKFVNVEEIKLVGQHAPLVIRALRRASGKCEVGAYIDVGSKVVQLKQIHANGRMLSRGLTGATVQFSGVQIIAVDGTVAADWLCTSDCLQNISADLFCRM
jgi:hypothetical protein